MKIHKLLFFIALFFSTVSCEVEDITEIEPQGDFITNFDFPAGDVFAPSKIKIINRSKYADKFIWEFPGGKLISPQGDILDVSTTTGVVPDSIFYPLPGTYTVTLTSEQNGTASSISKDIVVKKLQPTIVVPGSILFLEEAQFSANVFQYPGKPVTYAWDFGNGITSTEANPKVVFENPGNYTVTLVINDGEETLTTSTEILVKGELVKTLYYTDAKTGKLWRKRFTQILTSAPEQLPVNVGIHPLGLSVFNEQVIISDAGLHVSFAALGNADGRIFSVNLEGQNERVITTATGDYQNDPFSSTVDQNGNVWWMTRRNGLFSMPIASTNGAYPAAPRLVVTATNAEVSSTFGWLEGQVRVVNNVVWYSKHGSAGRGLYKYNLNGEFIESVPGLKDVRLRSFEIDTKFSKIYFAVNFSGGGLDKGLYVCNLDGSNITLIDPLANFSNQGGANEQTYVTDIAIDMNPDDGSAGYIYYPFRDASDVSATGAVIGTGEASGIKRFPLGGGGSPEFFLKGFIPYGLGIDQVKR